MRIYRYENESGKGPYQSGLGHFERLNRMAEDHNNSSHPAFSEDFNTSSLVGAMEKYYFGFESMETLNLWFAGFHTDLKECGFKISIYEIYVDNWEIKNVIRGISGRQIIFLKENAILVESF